MTRSTVYNRCRAYSANTGTIDTSWKWKMRYVFSSRFSMQVAREAKTDIWLAKTSFDDESTWRLNLRDLGGNLHDRTVQHNGRTSIVPGAQDQKPGSGKRAGYVKNHTRPDHASIANGNKDTGPCLVHRCIGDGSQPLRPTGIGKYF